MRPVTRNDEDVLLGRGLSFPPRVGSDGRLARSSGAQNVRECIRVLLATDRRERMRLPEFGGDLSRYLFAPNIPATHRLIQERIEQSLGRWEPRIEVESVVVEAHPDDPRTAVAAVRYRLVVTGVTDRIDLTLRLGD